jgi:hypothetical protein
LGRKKLRLYLSKYSRNKVPQNNMKKGDKEMKKVLLPMLALILALSMALVMAPIPVSAATYVGTTTISFSANPATLSGGSAPDVTITTTTAAEPEATQDMIDDGKVTIQLATDGAGNPVPTASVNTWVALMPNNVNPVNGVVTWNVDLDGLGFVPGTTGGFRAHYVTGGGSDKVGTHFSDAADLTATSPAAAISVEKDYRYTNVCFEKDNDGDGQFNEDPIDFDPDTGAPIDNDEDGQFNEDPVDCPDGTCLGDFLLMDEDGNYRLEAVVKRNVVKSYNPGQYYAVSTVNVLAHVDMLTIEEDFSGCIAEEGGISVLNPVTGGGRLVVVQVGPGDPEAVAYQILDAKSSEVSIVDGVATVSLGAQEAGTTILVYVKFGPGLKGELWTDELTCENTNSAWVVYPADDIVSDSAMLKLVLKE